MWVYYTSKDNVFWTNDTIDKPSKQYLESITWEEAKINVDMENIKVVTFFTKDNSIRLLKIVNDETNETYYYYFNKILRLVKSNWLVEFHLDYWLTYTINLLDKDVNVLAERHQDYEDDNYLMWDDELLNSLPLGYVSYTLLKKSFYRPQENRFTTPERKYYLDWSSVDDIVNANFVLVLNDTEQPDNNQAYTYIPILSRNNPVELLNPEPDRDEITVLGEFEGEFIGYNDPDYYAHYYIELDKPENKQLLDYFNYYWNDAYDFNIKAYCGREGYDDYLEYDFTEMLKQLKRDAPGKRLWEINASFVLKSGLLNIKWYDLKITCVTSNDGTTANKTYRTQKWDGNPWWWISNTSGPSHIKYVLKVWRRNPTGEFINQTIHNSLKNINNIIRSPQWSNKVLGVYVFPNFLNFSTSLWKIKSFNGLNLLQFNIPNNGISFNIDWTIDETSNDYKFNSNEFYFKIMLRYLDTKWFNNPIDLSRLKNNQQFWVNFTNSFNLKILNEKYEIKNQILSFPAQQPITIDKYYNYIQANMERVNTGYQIQKQQRDLGVFGSIFNMLKNTVSNTTGLVTSAMNANPLGMLVGGANQLGNLVDGATGVAKSVLSLENYEKSVRAHFADVNKVLGNELLFSSTEDTLFTSYMFETDQFDLLYLKILNSETVKLMNNTLLLNGVYNPKYFKLSEIKGIDKLGFKYVKLDRVNLNQQLSSYISQPLNIKEIMLSQISEFRIWDIIPNIEKTPE